MASGARRTPAPAGPPGGGPGGFTAVEMLVAVGVLAMMITMVTMILASTKRLITTSQAKMRANAAASAITELIRDDLRRTSKHGLLCITQAGPGGPVRLALAVPGTTQSLTSGVQGNGEFICYGLTDNPGSSTGGILFRAGWIMNADGGGADVMPNDFSELRQFLRPQLSMVVSVTLGSSPSGPLRVPPVKLQQIRNLWQVAAAHCSDLTIQWTDGAVAGGSLKWYGPDDPKDGAAWQGRDADSNEIEFNASGAGAGGGTYRALWTWHNQSDWPKAVKFRFRLRDPDMPAEFRSVWYEVVCPIGQ